MKKVLALTLAAVMVLAFAACSAPAEKEVLTMGTNAAFPPYEMVDEPVSTLILVFVTSSIEKYPGVYCITGSPSLPAAA
ncbi:MAG: hypothetical protein IJ949_00790, partial [Oscillospiraceae bacterium]|nr:hypothetical protein [Oscillospiraceae bacterium]